MLLARAAGRRRGSNYAKDMQLHKALGLPFNTKVHIDIDRGKHYPLKSKGKIVEQAYRGVEEALKRRKIICFGLFSALRYSTLLLLQPSNKEGEYVRVGLARHVPDVWFKAHAIDYIT